MVVALIALFVSLGGTAVAASVAVVPLAKRALVADNAKKLGGRTPAQVAAAAASTPGPANSVASLVTVKTASFSIAAEGETAATAQCDAGQKAISGGFTSQQLVLPLDTLPTSDGTGWQVFLINPGAAPAAGSVFVVCLR